MIRSQSLLNALCISQIPKSSNISQLKVGKMQTFQHIGIRLAEGYKRNLTFITLFQTNKSKNSYLFISLLPENAFLFDIFSLDVKHG